MKYNYIIIFLLLISGILAGQEIWYRETRYSNDELQQYTVYKKYTWKETEDGTLIRESFYNHYPAVDGDANSEGATIVHFEHKAETLVDKDDQHIYQEVTRYISNTEVFEEVIKAELEDQNILFYRNESGKYNLYKRKILNSNKNYFALSAKIPCLKEVQEILKRDGVENLSKTININIIAVSSGDIMPLLVKIQPPSSIPGVNNPKKFFVIRVSIEGGPSDIFEDIYFDNKGYIVYKKRNDNGNVTQRISKPKLEIAKHNTPKIAEIDPLISSHTDSERYFFTYPRSWKKTEKIHPFDVVYQSETGTIAGVIAFDKKFGDLQTLTLNTFYKFNDTRSAKEIQFDTKKLEKSKTIFLRGIEYLQTIVKTVNHDGEIRYYLVLTTIHNDNAFAIIAFGNEQEYIQNWPMWFNFAHSFYPK